MSFYEAVTREIRVEESVVDRFFSKILVGENPDDCWGWAGSLSGNRGYAGLTVRKNGSRQSILAHRLSYQIFVGELEPGLVVCHSCDNPRCANPAHLFQASQKDNCKDAVSKGRNVAIRPVASEILRKRDLMLVAALEGGKTQKQVSDAFGVSQPRISIIKKGLIGTRKRKISDKDVLDIYSRRDKPVKDVAAYFGISENTVKGIRSGRNYKVLKEAQQNHDSALVAQGGGAA